MRAKVLLAAVLLSLGLCLVPALGYGEVQHDMDEAKVSWMEYTLLDSRVNYIMMNPTDFLDVRFYYDPIGMYAYTFPEDLGIETVGKVYIHISDNRNRYADKTGLALLGQFKSDLEAIYSFIELAATDMDIDIVAKFHTEKNVPLAYFYQGEYYLWPREKQDASYSSERPNHLYDCTLFVPFSEPQKVSC